MAEFKHEGVEIGLDDRGWFNFIFEEAEFSYDTLREAEEKIDECRKNQRKKKKAKRKIALKVIYKGKLRTITGLHLGNGNAMLDGGEQLSIWYGYDFVVGSDRAVSIQARLNKLDEERQRLKAELEVGEMEYHTSRSDAKLDYEAAIEALEKSYAEAEEREAEYVAAENAKATG